MTVDKSLSRGLADRVLSEYAALARVYVHDCAKAARRIPLKRYAVQALANELRSLGERARLSQVVASHPRWRWAVVAAFLPGLSHEDASGGRNRTIPFHLLPIHIHAGKRVLLPSCSTVSLEVREHAFERLFQRLNSTDPDAVRNEIHGALCLAPHLRVAAANLDLKQLVLPTMSGAFLCKVRQGEPICAKTWIPYAQGESLRERVAFDISNCYARMGGATKLGIAVGEIPYGEILNAIERLPELENVLRRHNWLRQEYEPGVDREAEAWEKGRKQALARAVGESLAA